MKKIAIVTGGSRGIGAAISKLLASQGYAICVNFRKRKGEADAVVSEIIDHGGQAFACACDVSVEDDVIRMFDTVDKHYGVITHLVNNAGILFTQSRLSDLNVERFQQVFATNVTGTFLCCREAVKRMESGGAIVNVSSLASRTGSPNEYTDYAASKGAVDTLTKGLSVEVAAQGIRVNCVRPGFIHTEMHADGGEPNRVERLSPQIPMQRGGNPEEVANAIAWLLSDESSYVTGTFLDIAGGR